MEKYLFDLFMFGMVLVVIYYIFSNMNINNVREGLNLKSYCRKDLSCPVITSHKRPSTS